MTITARSHQHYAPGVPTTVEIPTGDLYAGLEAAATRARDVVALDFLGATTTYGHLLEQVERAAHALHLQGIKAGDRVALVLPNCPQHVIAFYAVLRLGAVVAEHNPLAPTEELEKQLARHGARVVIAWEPVLARLAAHHPAGADRLYVAVDLTAAMPTKLRLALRLPVRAARTKRAEMRAAVPTGTPYLERVTARAHRLDPAHPRPRNTDLAVLLHTGGTTGVPKAVMLTHRNLLANAAQGKAWLPFMRDAEEVILSVLPFFHAFGLLLCLVYGISRTSTLLLLPRFDVDLALAANRRRPITFLPAVPPILDKLEAAGRERGADFTACRTSLSGAMSLDPEVARRWEDFTGHLVIEGYGMTEASPIILGNPVSDARRPGALGVAFPSTEVRIVDPENPTVDVPTGQTGELIVRGPQVCQGYLNEPTESAQLFTKEGWLRTGDIVRDEDGFVVMADRRKELILVGGFNVYPSQVEEAVRSMPGVLDVAVVGMPSGSVGESVLAALVLEPGAGVTLEEVRAWAEKSISHYALPRQIAILTELPRSALGKVLRRSVREQLLQAQATVGSKVEEARELARQAAAAVSSALDERRSSRTDGDKAPQ
ncbi:AMP-binding protein [Buchananella hordeovulneris]|uniref:AMP-binding protein n=1 Tax=Buchananella hordeovulneris TaxID=52770 RepID=UPI0026DAD248|nr:AMP-binding protein [Buchananella hordeovulneris]MDO5080573.1 AMP-binding protein [Buchananella hordeovulneris]